MESGGICPSLVLNVGSKWVNDGKIWLCSEVYKWKNTTKNVVQYGTAFGPSRYGQIRWDFQKGPWHIPGIILLWTFSPLGVIAQFCPSLGKYKIPWLIQLHRRYGDSETQNLKLPSEQPRPDTQIVLTSIQMWHNEQEKVFQVNFRSREGRVIYCMYCSWPGPITIIVIFIYVFLLKIRNHSGTMGSAWVLWILPKLHELITGNGFPITLWSYKNKRTADLS